MSFFSLKCSLQAGLLSVCMTWLQLGILGFTNWQQFGIFLLWNQRNFISLSSLLNVKQDLLQLHCRALGRDGWSQCCEQIFGIFKLYSVTGSILLSPLNFSILSGSSSKDKWDSREGQDTHCSGSLLHRCLHMSVQLLAHYVHKSLVAGSVLIRNVGGWPAIMLSVSSQLWL